MLQNQGTHHISVTAGEQATRMVEAFAPSWHLLFLKLGNIHVITTRMHMYDVIKCKQSYWSMCFAPSRQI